MKMYKLVSQNYLTHGGMKWKIGATNKATAEGNAMCTNQVLHCYSNPHLAVLFNPIHANISNPRLLEIECSEIVATDGIKHACKEQTPTQEVVLPELTARQRVLFAIKCALCVYKAADFVLWATNYISGVDTSADAAARAADAADAAARAARAAARAAAARAAAAAAYAVARAADAAAYAADAARAADAAAYAVARAADAADAAAYAVARAADAADAAKLDFVEILQWTLEHS